MIVCVVKVCVAGWSVVIVSVLVGVMVVRVVLGVKGVEGVGFWEDHCRGEYGVSCDYVYGWLPFYVELFLYFVLW